MARTTRHPHLHPLSRIAACAAAVLLGGPGGLASAAEPAAKDAPITFTFPALGKERARLTVTPGEAGSRAGAFKVVVGTTSQTFTLAMPAAARTIEIPADARAFLRFSVELPGAPPTQALALVTPDSRPLLIADGCGVWDLATSGGSASAACFGRDRHCPVASHASVDRRLTLHQCGSGPVKFCVPDYRLEITGEKNQKVRAGVEGDLGSWLTLRGPKIRRLFIPSGGACPGVMVETSTDRVRLSLGWGQRVLVRLSPDGQIGAEDLPPEQASSGGGGE